MYVYKSTVESGVANAAFRAILLAAQSHAVPAEGKAPVSAVYPFSPVKANVSRLCEKLKSAMRSGLKHRCGGNFLAIFVGMGLGEKPNFAGRFFERRRPFDFSTQDKERCP